MKKCGKFSALTVMMVGEQLIERLQYMHQKNFIHRDIKPVRRILLALRLTDLHYTMM